MLTEKRWQKWDAIKHFICVIEFLWVIVRIKKQTHHTRITTKKINKTSFQWRRTKMPRILRTKNIISCVAIRRPSWYAFSFIFARFFSLVSLYSLHRRAHVPSMRQVIFFVFSLLLHYSFRCHFCSIYLNCKNTMHRARIPKKNTACSKCRINFWFTHKQKPAPPITKRKRPQNILRLLQNGEQVWYFFCSS